LESAEFVFISDMTLYVMCGCNHLLCRILSFASALQISLAKWEDHVFVMYGGCRHYLGGEGQIYSIMILKWYVLPLSEFFKGVSIDPTDPFKR